MNKIQDQWFEPGDKVVRVQDVQFTVKEIEERPSTLPNDKVLCVHAFINHPLYGNFVQITGYNAGSEWWSPAREFRRVEDIQLCVRAAQAMKQPQTAQPLTA